ncbi:hypothetical protein U1Q18_010196 [Sarracenia purpurea var. burkii]
MERNTGRGTMDQDKTYEQVQHGSVETRNEGLGSANQRFSHDPSTSVSTNVRPPDFNIPVGGRPVLNYSIQTGEEFALEFMRERVNSRQHFLPNPSADSNSAISYTDLKGILGISRAGSESGSDISMVSSMDKGRVQESERRGSSILKDKGYYESMQSAPQTLPRNYISRSGLSYTSSEISENSSTKVKFLCSWGGKILPRPSDGKLRYVGGETRIIRLSKDISWQDLMPKALAVYSQTHVIKYQLPGEDLDALVSVSCDEDLQNMMEECNLLEDGGSQKLRMFLFSSNELDDSQVGLGSLEGDSEIQYVVAVNDMDVGSRKNSIGLGITSGNNLDEFLNLNVERVTDGVADELAGTVPATLTANVPSSTDISSQPVVPSSSNTYGSNPQPYHGQMVDHEGEVHTLPTLLHDGNSTIPSLVPLQYGFVSHGSTYAPLVENLVQTHFHGHLTGQEGSAQHQTYRVSHVPDPEVSLIEEKVKRESTGHTMSELEKNRSIEKDVLVKEAKTKIDSSVQKSGELGGISYLEKEYVVPSHPHDSSILNYIPREASDPKFTTDSGASLLPTEKYMKHSEPVRNAIPTGALNEGNLNKLNEHGELRGDSTEFRYLEQSVLPQRVFHSERLPREQIELNRLSKSEDSFDSQVLRSHAHSDASQLIDESVDKLQDGNVASQSEQSFSSAKPVYVNPRTVVPAQSHNYNEAADYFDRMNSNISEEAFESKFHNSVLKPVVLAPVDELARVVNNYRYQTDINMEASGMNNQVVSQGPSSKLQEESVSRAQESYWGEITPKKSNENSIEGNAHPFAQVANPVKGPSRGDSAHVGTSERGDILIDINDRFPPDFLSDIFSKAKNSEDLAGISLLHGDGAGLSLNMENHDPKHWSFFQKLVQSDFGRKDVSLMDQDHLGFSSSIAHFTDGAPIDYSFPPLKTEGVAMHHMDSRINYETNFQPQSSGAVGPNTVDLNPKDSPYKESTQLDGLVNPRIPEPDIKDEKLEAQHTPLVELPLGEFDLNAVQVCNQKVKQGVPRWYGGSVQK